MNRLVTWTHGMVNRVLWHISANDAGDAARCGARRPGRITRFAADKLWLPHRVCVPCAQSGATA